MDPKKSVFKQEIKEEDEVSFELIEDQSYSPESVKEESVLNEIEQVESCVDLIDNKSYFVVDGIKEEGLHDIQINDNMEFKEEEINCVWSQSTLNERDPLELSKMQDTSLLPHYESAQSSSSANTDVTFGQCTSMPFDLVPGNRRGARLFTSGDGYYYTFRFANESKSHYVCYRTNCEARVWVSKGDTTVDHRNDKFPWHNHGTEHFLGALNVLRETIISRVQRESLLPKRIFDEECNKVPTDISKHLSFEQIESNLQKSRKKCFPRLPNSPVEFNDMLTSEEWQGRFSKTLNGNTFYRGNVVIQGKNNLVFLSENMEHLFESAEEIYMDGTFKTVPSVPGLKHLFVIMAISYDHAFPVCYVLMENRTYLSYKAVFAKVKSIVPQLNPKIIISDFEGAIMKASKEEFPDAVITGCWWHFANRILKKAKSLRIGVSLLTRDENVRNVMHICMALPLLPQENMEAGLAAIRQVAAVTVFGTVNNVFTSLFAYILSQWIQKVGADRLTVCGAPRRTYNDSESFNISLKREMGHAHLNAWAFVDGLKSMEKIETTNLERVQNGLPLGRSRKRRFLLKEKVIKTATQNLEAGRTTEREFLSTAAAVIDRKVNFELQEDEEEDDDEDEVDRPPSPPPAARADAPAAIAES